MTTIRAISIHQPYATLIAQGRKQYETRPRPIRTYRGQLLICAAKATPFQSTLSSFGLNPKDCPLEVAVAIAHFGHLSKSISDAGWYQFRKWIEYFGRKFGKITIAVPPHFTSQDCPECGKRTPKSLSNRTHNCSCGFCEDRDVAASMTVLQKALRTVGHTGTAIYKIGNASGDIASTGVGEILPQQAESLNEEPR